MSYISEQVRELREIAEMYDGMDGGDILREAAKQSNICGVWVMRCILAVSTTNRILQLSGKVAITWV